MRTAFGQHVMATDLTGGALGPTILARTDQRPVSPLARIQRRVATAPTRKPRPSHDDPSGKAPKTPRRARRLRRSDAGSGVRSGVRSGARSGARTDLSPLVMDPQIRSVILWPRDYR